MTKADKDRIDQLARDMVGTYGPTMNRQQLMDALNYKTPGGVSVWLTKHGMTARRIGQGLYVTRDVATALILGSAV